MVTGHIKKIRQSRMLAGSVIKLDFEANMGWDRGSRYQREFKSHPELYGEVIMSHHQDPKTKETKWGSWMTGPMKERGVQYLKESLMRGALCYAEDMISQDAMIAAKNRALFANQLRYWREETKEPADLVLGKFKKGSGGKGPGGKRDDIVLGIQQIIRERNERCVGDPDFQQLAQQRGWTLF